MDDGQAFVPPPEAPVFEPSEEDFSDPLAYIAKIRPIAEKTGICKIRPPPDWQPPFAVDVENFKFTPRIQRLNELEAKTRIKLNFLDSIAKFWELQGCRLKIPNVCGKCLDLYNLSKIVQDEGGFEFVCRERRWSRVANRLHYPPGKGVGSQLLKHYERILWPYDVFHSGASFDQPVQPLPEGDAKDKDYVPHGIPSRQAIKPPSTGGYSRRVKRQAPECSLLSRTPQEPLTVDISNNPELKKLQLFGPGPKFAGLGLVAHPGEKKGSFDETPMMMSPERNGLDGSWAKLDRQSSTTEQDVKETKGTPKKASKSSPRKAAQDAAAAASSMQMRARAGNVTSLIETYMCHVCGRGDVEDCLLLCDGCDDSFHTFCLIPPLPEVPKGDWRCPSCVAKGLSKPQDPFGFETARREYSLQTFGEKADQFKKDYFSMPVHMVPPEQIEKEFWRLVQSVEDDVLVEYGADIHTLVQGSGFPTKKSKVVAAEDQEYITSPWNLNNLPVQSESVLCHINADISGMKVPWIYVGMCFSSFCWHNEDHWSYSINYLHWGEPKTWYGVPGSAADLFEKAMRSQAPELFEAQPDLLHQLVTIMSPTILMNHGVPIVRTNQCAGEFVVTFPRAYHAGFNQGYNFAEAVNFCPADWLPMGRQCIDYYRSLQRVCVFSHEELVCKMAADPESLDLSMAAAVYKEMLYIVNEEKRCRKALLERGITEAEREAFELLPDDERQCESCKTTCFLSAITCPCTPNKLVCIHHVDKLCECQSSKHCLRYRYTLDELPAMLHNLKIRAESFDNWANKVQNALKASQDSKLDIVQLKEMIEEADEKHFPDNELLQQLMNAVAEAERCASVALQLVNKKHKTRSKSIVDSKYVSKLNYEELTDFMEQVHSLPCEIREALLVQKLVDEVEKFRSEAHDALSDAIPNSDKLKRLLEVGSALDIELPEIPKLKLELHQARWLDDVRATLALPTSVTLETLRKLIDSGVSLAPHQAIEKAMAELQELLTVSERWEEKAKLCLAAKPRHAIATLEAIINEARNIPVHLPNTIALKEALKKAKDWSKQIEDIQSGEHFPYLDVLECMVVRGRTIPVRLEQLAQVESQVAAARAWRERAGRTFLKKNTSYALLEVLSPRTDIGQYLSGKARRKKQKDLERLKEQEKEYATDVDIGSSTSGSRDPVTFMASYKNAEVEELDAINTLRDKNRRKQQLEEDGVEQGKYCVCRKPVSGFMLQCELCKDWFHTTCVPLPKASSKSKFSNGLGGSNVSTSSGVQNIKDVKFLCPMCLRSRRPRLETILSLLVSLQKLPVRLPEGEALQRLTEHAMNWQDRAKQALATDELSDALTRLSSMSHKMMEQAAKAKTDRIISAELKKAARKSELQERVESITSRVTESSNKSVHQDSILHGMLPVPTQSDGMVLDQEEEQVDMDMGVSITMDVSSDDVGVDVPPVMSSGMDTGFVSEHAYSAASKPALSQPSKKHPRKTPLIPRSIDPTSPPPSLSSSTGSQSATLELSLYARAQLEDLMVEGDLLEVSLDDTQQLWRILQACQPVHQERFMEHILEQMPPESLEKLKVKSEAKEKKKMKLKRKKDDIEIMSAEMKLEKKKKKKEKREKELAAPGTAPLIPQKKLGEKVKKEGKENKEKQKKKMKRKKAEKLLVPGNLPIKKEDIKEEVIINVDGDEDDDDEICSAKKCLRPLGDDINWVQCDMCEKWYHLLCIGMKQQPEEDEEFFCRVCTKKRSLQKAGGQKSKQKTDSTTPSPAATPTKQIMSPISSQEIVTKTVGMTQGVMKVQSSGRSSGRNSPVSVSSGRNSPSVATVKVEPQGGSGRNSPALSTSGRRTPSALSLGRNSPLTLGSGRSSPATVPVQAATSTQGSGRNSPAAVPMQTATGTLGSGRSSPVTVPMQTTTSTKPPALPVKDRRSPVFATLSEMIKDDLPGLDITSKSALSVQKNVDTGILPLNKDKETAMVCEDNDQTLGQKETIRLDVVTKPSSDIKEVKASPSADVVPLVTSPSSDEESQSQQEDSVVSVPITDSQETLPTNDVPSTSVTSSQSLCESVQASDTDVKSETVEVTSMSEDMEEIKEASKEPLITEDPKCENTMPDSTCIPLPQSNVDNVEEFTESKQDDDVEPMPVDESSDEEIETKTSDNAVPESSSSLEPPSPSSGESEVQLVKEACLTPDAEGEQRLDDIEVAIESEILPEDPSEPATSQSPVIEDPVLPVAFNDTPTVQPSSPPTLIKEPEIEFQDPVETLRPPLVEPVELAATEGASSKALDAPALIQEAPNEQSEPMEITEELSENEPKQETDSQGESFPERVCTENEQMDSNPS
nr:lysine-specific demethylase 5A-like isoform X1 [Lytechinus pictus]